MSDDISPVLRKFSMVLDGIVNSTKSLGSKTNPGIDDYDDYVIKNMTTIQAFENNVGHFKKYEDLVHFLYLQFEKQSSQFDHIEEEYELRERPYGRWYGPLFE